VPVLVGLARLFKVERVLELGCGIYSTPLFLDRNAFPDLIGLHSMENDPYWAAQLAPLIGLDPRGVLTVVPGPISQALDDVKLRDYDLILVDDSTGAEQRAATIRQLAGRCSASSLVVIHDYDVRDYRDAASGFQKRFAFTALNPSTGVGWSDWFLDKRRLRRLNKLITRFSSSLKTEDPKPWVEVMNDGSNWR
jgi:predicted O-methyltransferase YrrM